MNVLLDTCTFLWLAAEEARLSEQAARLFADPANEVFLSAVSAWEIAVKHRLGRLRLPQDLDPRDFVPEARRRHVIEPLGLHEADTFGLAKLPPLHADPFDRMLVCQAIANQMVILTPDPLIAQYPVAVRW
jgi:PIN domain nuclease of toxin-antitoxin system